MHLRARRRSVLGIVGLFILLAALAPFLRPVAAAEPSASPSSSAAPSQAPEPAVEIWLDEPLPDEIEPGSDLSVAFVLWDTRGLALLRDSTPFVRLRSPSATEDPVNTVASEDSPGHFIATVAAPAEGTPALEVGFPGMTCEPRGSPCRDVEFIFAIGGVGPPPGARLNTLARATIASIPKTVLAGQPAEVTVELDLVGPWQPADVDLPSQLFVLTHLTRDTARATAVRSTAGSPLTFVGSLTFPDPGSFDIDVGADPERTAQSVFDGSLVKVSVADAPLVAVDGAPPIVPIAIGLVILVRLVLVARRVLADL